MLVVLYNREMKEKQFDCVSLIMFWKRRMKNSSALCNISLPGFSAKVWNRHTHTHTQNVMHCGHIISSNVTGFFAFNPLTPELNSSSQRYLTRLFTGDFAA
jgi:hypothetical protein